MRLGKRKTTARRATGGSQRPPQPPRQPATGGSSSASAIQISFVTTFRRKGMNYSKALSSMSVVEM